jgi:hypothetical protein
MTSRVAAAPSYLGLHDSAHGHNLASFASHGTLVERWACRPVEDSASESSRITTALSHVPCPRVAWSRGRTYHRGPSPQGDTSWVPMIIRSSRQGGLDERLNGLRRVVACG